MICYIAGLCESRQISCVSRYFFHVQNQTSYTRDEVGGELSGLEAARNHAADAAGQIITSELRDGNPDPTFEIQVEDEHGKRVLTFNIWSTVATG